MSKRLIERIRSQHGCWIPILYDATGNHRTVMCSECREMFRYAHEKCTACGIRMMFDPYLVYNKGEEENA